MRVLGGRAAIAALVLSLPVALVACGHVGSSPAAPTNGVLPSAAAVPTALPVPPLDRTERFVTPAGPVGPRSVPVA